MHGLAGQVAAVDLGGGLCANRIRRLGKRARLRGHHEIVVECQHACLRFSWASRPDKSGPTSVWPDESSPYVVSGLACLARSFPIARGFLNATRSASRT